MKKRMGSEIRKGTKVRFSTTDGIICRTHKGRDVDLTCEACGEPIGVFNPEFGMDCKNGCQEKQFNKNLRDRKLFNRCALSVFRNVPEYRKRSN